MSVALSTDSTFTPDSGNEGEKSSAEALVSLSTTPNELLDKPTTFTSVFISVLANALLVKTELFTVKGETFEGASTTLDT